MKNSRQRKLKVKQRDLQASLERWATKNGLLCKGEHLRVELRIIKDKPHVTKPRVVFYEKAPQGVQLPSDDILRSDVTVSGTDLCSIWHLTDEDWETLDKLNWNEQQQTVFAMLRAHNNGPLHISDFNAQGVHYWKPGQSSFVTSFDRVLGGASDYEHCKVGSRYYSLSQLEGKYRHYYAIRKLQYCIKAE